jgi:hypothetical protein
MPIELVWFEDRDALEGPWQPGWAFPLGYRLSKHYKCRVAKIRPAISVMLPGRDGHASPFCIDSYPTDKPDEAWEVVCPWPLVVAEKPLITVRPSINAVGSYHGHLTDGVLTDDIGD